MAKPYIPYDGPLVTRQEALADGRKRYFTGKLCRNMHIAERYVNGGRCLACHTAECSKQYKRHKSLRIQKAKCYYTINLPKIKQYKVEYHQKNKHAIVEKVNFWINENREKASANWRASRHRRRSAEGNWNAKNILVIGSNQKWLCVGCDCLIVNNYHVDHVMPIAKGGSNWPDNLQLLCPSCNMKKSDKHPFDWFSEIGRPWLGAKYGQITE